MIAANSTSQCSHCVVCLNNVTDQISQVQYPGYEIRFSPEKADLQEALLSALPLSLPAPYNLTERECDIIRKLREGLSSKMIAERLSISKHTVDTHRRNLLKKLRVGNTAGALQKAYRLGSIRCHRKRRQ